MSTEYTPESLKLRFDGGLAEHGQIPATVLMEVLSGFQRTIHLLAMDLENLGIRSKDRVTQSIDSKYVLMCSPPQPGSYVVAVHIGDPMSDLFAPDNLREVTRRFHELCKSATSGNRQDSFISLLPDNTRRKKVFESLRRMIPKIGSGIRLVISDGEDFFDSTKVSHFLQSCLKAHDEEETRTITGRLIKIDFDAKDFTIEYPPTRKELKCHYSESVEDLLLENPREFIQVTGKVTLDEGSDPKVIREVEDIREVDLSPFHLSEFHLKDKHLRFNKPKELQPFQDETKQLLCLKDTQLGIDICGYSREDLEESLTAELDFLWMNYASASAEDLSEGAIKLRESLLAAIEVVHNA